MFQKSKDRGLNGLIISSVCFLNRQDVCSSPCQSKVRSSTLPLCAVQNDQIPLLLSKKPWFSIESILFAVPQQGCILPQDGTIVVDQPTVVIHHMFSVFLQVSFLSAISLRGSWDSISHLIDPFILDVSQLGVLQRTVVSTFNVTKCKDGQLGSPMAYETLIYWI